MNKEEAMKAIEEELQRFLTVYHQGQRDDYLCGIIEGLKIALEALEGKE